MKKVITLICVVGLLVGCAPGYYNLHSSTHVQPATIITKNATHTFIKNINGRTVGSGVREVVVDVPPGVVTITPFYYDGNLRTTSSSPDRFNVESGHTYLVILEKGRKTGGGGGMEYFEMMFYLLDQGTYKKIFPIR